MPVLKLIADARKLVRYIERNMQCTPTLQQLVNRVKRSVETGTHERKRVRIRRR